jgi:hypothetical protein
LVFQLADLDQSQHHATMIAINLIPKAIGGWLDDAS